jgi:transposase InsO family protein
MSVGQMCLLGEVSRAGFYRFRTAPAAGDADIDLRDAIQRIALEFPSYGRPRITAELHRRGWAVGHNRVHRIMREDNLLCLRRRKFVVATTNSNHSRPVYPNLAGDMELTGLNQLWVADITYIRLEMEFVYLAVVLDAFSRRVIGWALDRSLEDDLTIAALGMALQRRSPAAGLVHHSDRGVQYASAGYTGFAESQPHHHQHEPEGESLRQRHLRVVHEDPEVRRSLPAGIPGSGRGAAMHRTLPRKGLQRTSAPLVAGIRPSRRIRRFFGRRWFGTTGRLVRIGNAGQCVFSGMTESIAPMCHAALKTWAGAPLPAGSGPGSENAPEVNAPYPSSR